MKRQTNAVLLAEDDHNDRFILQRAFKTAGLPGPLLTVCDGEEALRYLRGEGEFADRARFPFPSTIFTDLKMPRVSGFEVLRYIRSRADWAVIPVIVFSSSSDDDDIKKAYLGGASTYFVKCHGADLVQLLSALHHFWSQAEVPQVDAHGCMVSTCGTNKLGEHAADIRNAPATRREPRC